MRVAHFRAAAIVAGAVLLLTGCVQPAMAPNINAATARVLDAAGIQTLVAERAGCCGAIREHLADHHGALDDMRRNIDAWEPIIDRQRIEAIVINASGCSATVKDYAHALRGDKRYAERAARIEQVRAVELAFVGRAIARHLGSHGGFPCPHRGR